MPTHRAEASAAAVLALLLMVAAAQLPVARAMVDTWATRDTYAHGFFVVPIVAAWIWLRRATLAALPVAPSWLGLAVLVPLAGAAVLLEALGFNAPRQFVLVATVPAAIAAVLGTAWVRALAFPLAYLFFAVPAGDALVPLLIDATADAVVTGLQLVGIPVYREADRISIPSGHWHVADACSGVRYLVACAAVGTVYAAAMYRSAARRIAFIAAMLVAAVVANWLRALAIVLLAHATDNRLAVGVDHLIYGWVMFGAIVAAMFWLGARWQQPPQAEPAAAPAHGANLARALPAALIAAALAAAPLAAQRPDAEAALPALEIAVASPWHERLEPATAWRPALAAPARRFGATFTDGAAPVALELAVWSGSGKAYASVNRLVAPTDDRWQLAGRADVPVAGIEGPVPAAAIRGDRRLLVVWQFYAVDGVVTGSATRAAWQALRARLAGRDGRSAWISLATPADEAEGLAPARLEAFWRAVQGPVEAALKNAAPEPKTRR